MQLANRDEVIKAAKESLNFFAALCIPDVYKFAFPPVFLAIWQILTEGAMKEVGQDKLAIGLPRGFGKTILLKLYVAWLIAFTDRKFIVVVCNTATLAENFIADVMDILSSDNFIRVFGDWRIGEEKDTQALKKFTFRGRPVILAALGSGSSLRGLNIKFVRPDTIIMDDMQSREEAESQVEAGKMLNWMLSTLLKANNKTRCQFTFVGNMYPFDGSILKKLKHNPTWLSFICGAILEDGGSIWPELRTIEDIMDELENDISMGHPEIFFSEVMNDEEAGNRAGIDITKIKMYHETEELVEAEAGFVLIDPSVGKKKSDDVAIGCVLVFDGKPVLWDLAKDKFNPKQQIAKCIEMCMKYNVSVVLVESVAYQATLVFWFNQIKAQMGLGGINALEIYPGVASKNTRIMNALKLLVSESRDLMLHPRVKSQITHQIVHWNPLKSKNIDDALDILAYAPEALSKFGLTLLRPFYQNIEVKASFTDTLEIGF